MNEIKSFTLYKEIVKLINTLKPIEKRDAFIGKIIDFYFKDIEPIFETDSDEEAIWDNISKPIIKYKINALNGSKGGRTKTQTETESITQSVTQSITQTESTSNDVIVNVNVNNLEEIGYGEEKPLVTDDTSSLAEITKKVIEHLNAKTKSSFRYSSKATQSKIKARLNEGYVLDDFIDVIDKKVLEWTGTEFEKYLCPETLFGTKFEKYLNQKSKDISVPDWFNKKIEPTTDIEKQKELEELLKEFK